MKGYSRISSLSACTRVHFTFSHCENSKFRKHYLPSPPPPFSFYLSVLCILPHMWLNLVLPILFLYCACHVSSQLSEQKWWHARPPSKQHFSLPLTTSSIVTTARKSLLPTLCGSENECSHSLCKLAGS